MVQWIRIYLPKQGTQVQSPLWRTPCCRATEPVPHNYLADALEPMGHQAHVLTTKHYYVSTLSPHAATTDTHVPAACAPSTSRETTTMRSQCTKMERSRRSPQLEKAHVYQQRPSATKNKYANIYTCVHMCDGIVLGH